MIPSVQINKVSGSLGVSPTQDVIGKLAIIAPRVQGPSMKKGPSTPTLQSKPGNVNALFDYGLVDEIAEYVITESKNAVLIVAQDFSTPAALGTPVVVGSGNLASGDITADSAFGPVDDFDVAIRWTLGGVLGTGPVKYQYSIDSRDVADTAKVWSAVQSLGTATTIAIPTTGIILDLANAKTVATGDYFKVHVTGPRLTDADVQPALDRLGRSTLPWEIALIEGIDATSTTVANADAFLAGLEAKGKYRAFIVGARLRNQASESETDYIAAMASAWGSVASIRGSVTADGGYLTSVPRGVDMIRKTSIPYAARLMSVGVTVDAARVRDDNLPNVRLVDGDGNGQFHDELNDPGLDDQRLVSMRSFSNKSGAFITNPLVISNPGNDFQLMQQVRTVNRGCELAFGALTDELSDGIFTDQTTGFIREDAAQDLEGPPNNAMRAELGKKVTFIGFTLSRDDVFTPPTAVLTGQIKTIMPVYIKGFLVQSTLVRTITVSTTVGG